MLQYGLVTRINDGEAVLQVPRSSACGDKCGSCSGQCNKGVIQVEMKNTLDAKIGDRVEIESKSGTILGAAFLVYILPLITLFIGVFITNTVVKAFGFVSDDIISFLVGIGFMALTFVGIKMIDRKVEKTKKQIFMMTRLV